MSAKELNENEMRLLTEVLCGDRSERDLEVQTAMVANPTFREELEGLRQLRDGLDAAGDRQREVLASNASVSTHDAALVATTLARLARPAKVHRMRWPWLAAAAAAAALVLTWWAGWFAGDGPRIDDPRQLAGSTFSALKATAVADGIDLSWACTVAGHRTFTVVISDPLDLGWTPVEFAELNEPRWHLDASTAAKLPKTALWRVRVTVIPPAGGGRAQSFESADVPLR